MPVRDPSDSPRSLRRQYDYWRIVYLRTWKGSVVSSFLQPLLYVAAMGLLLGDYIDDTDSLGGATSYLAFIAPGLLVGQAMQVAAVEATYPVMSGLKWQKTYYAAQASPLGAGEIAAGHLMFIGFRVSTSCLVFAIVLAPFGVYASVFGAIVAFVVSLMVGLAFATVIYGFAAGVASEQWFALLFRLGILPMFLFSGAFFPIANLGDGLEFVARLTPLWHGVDLARMASLGAWELSTALIHVVYLTAMTGFGYWWARHRLTARMVL